MAEPLNGDRRIGEHVRIGSFDFFRRSLEELEKRLRAAGDALFIREDLQEGCRVYPALARATADQIRLLAVHAEEEIEITAGVCRLVFEMNVVLRYCLLSAEKLVAYADQAVADDVSIQKALKTLSHSGTNPTVIGTIDRNIADLRDLMARHNRNPSPDRRSTRQMAKAVGLQQDYEALYGLFSKYVHASAWFVLRPRKHTDTPDYRMTMQVYTQLHANDTLHRLLAIAGVVQD